jgi:hypothetical protein
LARGRVRSATPSTRPRQTNLSGPDSSDALADIEVLRFGDGAVDLADGDPLFDPLAYLIANPGDWAAKINPPGARSRCQKAGTRRPHSGIISSGGHASCTAVPPPIILPASRAGSSPP